MRTKCRLSWSPLRGQRARVDDIRNRFGKLVVSAGILLALLAHRLGKRLFARVEQSWNNLPRGGKVGNLRSDLACSKFFAEGDEGITHATKNLQCLRSRGFAIDQAGYTPNDGSCPAPNTSSDGIWTQRGYTPIFGGCRPVDRSSFLGGPGGTN